MLVGIPGEVSKICDIAKQQTIHHNLLPYFEIPRGEWSQINRIWPRGAPFPGMSSILRALKEVEPYQLSEERKIKDRLIGGCILESVFLTGLLRSKNIPSRIRSGYFKDTMSNREHIIAFWENVSRVKGIEKDLLDENADVWKEVMNNLTIRQQIETDKHIEHWVCEYWDQKDETWKLLDANNTFLKASSNIEVGYHLPKKHFEFAHEAWTNMRHSEKFNPSQYSEWPQDGRSHIRSQLLFDFYNLLNHELIGYDDRSGEIYTFVKKRNYDELTTEELSELDSLAELLYQNPTRYELVRFYLQSKTLNKKSAEIDSYSFVYKKFD